MAANERQRPLLVYDGDWAFCAIWVEHWQRLVGDTVDFAPYQGVAPRFPHIPRDQFATGVHFILPDGTIHRDAEAVFVLLKDVPRRGWLLPLYRRLPGFAASSELCYRFIAAHRDFFYRLTKLLWGDDVGPHMYILTRWLFLRGLGVIYLLAFGALSVQILGLVGSNGILPVEDYLTRVSINVPTAERFLLVPTMLWFNTGDAVLQGLCYGGMALSILLIVNLFPAPVLALLWGFYLSLATAGQTFLSFQWDALLLEVGFLAIFLGPLPFGRLRLVDPPVVVVWLFRWLLFRLMFSSGIIKLASGDPTWADLSALDYHYWTQPIPTPLAWYAAQLPLPLHRAATFTLFVIELALPFLFFLPRRPRLVAGFFTVLLQVLILLTGNYTFFNWLTILLCVWLLDDSLLRRFFPRGMIVHHVRRPRPSLLRRLPLALLALTVLFLSGTRFASTVLRTRIDNLYPEPLARLTTYGSQMHVANSYGLFANMTTTRPEILIEGSHDGDDWHEYTFYYKAGDIHRAPPWVAPYHPRLDWQLWFAAYGSYQRNPWFINFVRRLLEGSPEVLALLEHNPFPDEPPRFVRARVLDYRFSDPAAHDLIGAWWTRDNPREYLPPVSLESLE